jgi:hypothetical protein
MGFVKPLVSSPSIVTIAILITLIATACQSAGSSGPPSQSPDATTEAQYLDVYQTDGGKLDAATTLMNTNCGSVVVASTLCVVAAENALDTDLTFLVAVADATIPTRFVKANGLLYKALSHGARGFYLRIESLRDKSMSERDQAFSELAVTGQLLHSAYEAFPPDVRNGVRSPA